ncbi:hypothetical protein [Bizionia myxarmorum]|uniref:Uncharacterized protein n=1 Tax=Bizionia myxarmorum TaxID=291186 RepID=A0A5D0RBD4_9FLAO|nr:hypothetical protein [Bizionia myxarmorum]TYB78693.1 hypothetical protein ES674_02620 [Bizionia myxarmorum]
MKNIVIVFTLALTTLMSCDTDFDNDPTTVCNAKFYAFQASNEATVIGDMLNVGYLTKFNPNTAPVFNNSIPNSSFNDEGTLFYPTSALKNDNSQLVSLAAKTGGKRLLKADFPSATVTQNSTISSDLSAVVYVNNDLRFLKITDKVNQISAPYNDVINFKAELVDESGTSFSGAPQIINLPDTVENGFRDSNIEGVFLDNKVYFLANCQLLVYDLLTSNFNVETIASYAGANDRKFMQGLEISQSNTLLMMKQTVLPNYKIEILELPSISAGDYTSTSLFNLEASSFPANSPQLSSIINAQERRSTTYDSCDNTYYFTFMSSYSPYNTSVYEIDLNAFSIANYPFNNSYIFGLEVQK